MSPVYVPGKLVLAKQFTWNETVWNPSMISTALWLDAADASTITTSSGAVDGWRDKSGNNRHATATGTARPAYSATGFNGKPTIDFDGINDQLDLVQFAQTSGQNIWMVADTASLGSGYRAAVDRTSVSVANLTLLFAGQGVGSGNYRPAVFWNLNENASWGSTVQRKAIIRWSFYTGTPAAALVQVDGLAEVRAAYTASALTSWSTVNLGSIQQSDVNISELLMTPSDLSDQNRQKLEGYLAHKWGLTANLPAGHPYKTVGPTP